MFNLSISRSSCILVVELMSLAILLLTMPNCGNSALEFENLVVEAPPELTPNAMPVNGWMALAFLMVLDDIAVPPPEFGKMLVCDS